MTIKKINPLHPQPLQTPLTRLPRITRIIPNPKRPILLQHPRKFSRQKDIIPLTTPPKPLPDQILTIRINVRRIPERGAQFVRLVEDLEAVFIGLDGAVETRKAHGAEAKGSDVGTLEI